MLTGTETNAIERQQKICNLPLASNVIFLRLHILLSININLADLTGAVVWAPTRGNNCNDRCLVSKLSTALFATFAFLCWLSGTSKRKKTLLAPIINHFSFFQLFLSRSSVFFKFLRLITVESTLIPIRDRNWMLADELEYENGFEA